MSRPKDKARLNRIQILLREYPKGLRQGQIAKMLGLHRSTVMRALPALEDMGILLMEDDRGYIGLFQPAV